MLILVKVRGRIFTYDTLLSASDGLVARLIEHWVGDEDHALNREQHLHTCGVCVCVCTRM